MPQVSVVMPVYNGQRYLAEAIESILTQSCADFELIIVDDGSGDNSAAIIRAYAERDERIRFFQHERNRGRADAMNTGIAAAESQYITRMDCDDVSLPERLEKQVAFLESNPGIGALGACGKFMNRDLATLRHDFIVPTQHALIALQHFLGYGFIGATVLYRRDCLIAVGGYEPGRRYVDDLELMSRLLDQTPIRLANLPDILYLYRRHDQLKFRDPNSGPHIEGKKLKRRDLQRLGFAEPEATMGRLPDLRRDRRLSWAARRAGKQDLKRLIDGLIERSWVEPGDRATLEAEMNDILEHTSPRLWQMFCHWRRHHFGGNPLLDNQGQNQDGLNC